MKRTPAALTACLLGLSFPASAFGPPGHQQVGAIADALIQGSQAEQQVKRILQGQSLQKVAIWADCAKSVKEHSGHFAYERPADSFKECVPLEGPAESQRFVSFVQRNWTQCGTAGSQKCHEQYHFADVANVHLDYRLGYVGTSDHDVVHAITAAMDYLRHRNTGGPFSFADEREALTLLAHYMGDIHQPLHVVSIYLDQLGQTVNPEGVHNSKTDTAGGNGLQDAVANFNLHSEWDHIPDDLMVGGAKAGALLAAARKVGVTAGDTDGWSVRWATETVTYGPLVFGGLSFAAQPAASKPTWNVAGIDDAYNARANQMKAEQLAKAGARLAQLLQAIWPERPPKDAVIGYLEKRSLPEAKVVLPPTPANGDSQDVSDVAAIAATRTLLGSDRGAMAAADDVFDPAAIVARFNEALGVRLSMENAPTLMLMIKRVQADASEMTKPVKQNIAQGGRVRPFVREKEIATCLSPKDLANNKDQDLNTYSLAQSGSYPSTHALLGMAVGLMLGQVAPDKADTALARGYEFGESRVVCGFHYPSDVNAGRQAAVALMARLSANAAFAQDLRQAGIEVSAARGLR